MSRFSTSNLVIFTMLTLSIVLTVYAILIASKGLISGSNVYTAWMLIFSILVAVWADQDKRMPVQEKFSGYSFLVLILWPILLLYHLIKTRGIEGFVTYSGFWALYIGPNFFNIIMQLYV